jgi:tetratricopeptide (TPR) repeat protein
VETDNRATTRRRNWMDVLICAALIGVTLILYAQAANFDYLNIDDDLYVTANTHVQEGLSWHGIAWAFKTFFNANWHPLTWLSYMLDMQMFGMNPGPQHVHNAILHAINAVLLFTVLRQLTLRPWPSAAAAALFAVHPLRVESVAWISERKDVLSTSFWLLTTLSYIAYVRRGGRIRSALLPYVLCLLALALGLMAKPMLVTLPFTLLLLDFWPLQRIDSIRRIGWLIVEKIPMFIAVLGSAIISYVAQSLGGATGVRTIPLDDRIANAIVSIGQYLRMFVAPRGLAIFYPHAKMYRDGVIPISSLVLSAAVLVLLSTVAIVQVRRRPWLLVGWLWFLGTLVPVIGLVQVGSQSMADRYTYVPMIGIAIALVWTIGQWLEQIKFGRELAISMSAIVLAAFCAVTWHQLGFWRNTETVMTRAIDVVPNNYLAHYNLGSELAHEGKHPAAIEHFRAALEIKPNFSEAYYNLGVSLFYTGQLEEAIKSRPNFPEAHFSLGNALLSTGRPQEAIEQYQQAIKQRPDYVPAHDNLGVALLQIGQPEQAVKHHLRALQLDPNYSDAHNNLGNTLNHLAKPQEAIEHFRKALELKPDAPEVYINMAISLAKLNQPAEAIAAAEKALTLAGSQGQTGLEGQVETWLSNYRAAQAASRPSQ